MLSDSPDMVDGTAPRGDGPRCPIAPSRLSSEGTIDRSPVCSILSRSAMLPRPAMSTVILLTVVACFAVITSACDIGNTKQGCKIAGGYCTCGYGCKTEYIYDSKDKCMDAIRERGNNICLRRPCLNGGSCIQITSEPGFTCRCEGTGYHGSKCEKACPISVRRGEIFPYQCVVI